MMNKFKFPQDEEWNLFLEDNIVSEIRDEPEYFSKLEIYYEEMIKIRIYIESIANYDIHTNSLYYQFTLLELLIVLKKCLN